MRSETFALRRSLRLAALGLSLFILPGASRVDAAAAVAPLSRVRFQLRCECQCTSCGFAMQLQLRKLPGVVRVDLSIRERAVTVAFDEGKIPLSRVAAALAGCELGKRCALIGDLADARAVPDVAALARVPGVRAAELEPRKGRLLIELVEGMPLTTAGLTVALEKAGLDVRFDRPAINK